jgi:hypothetical protein
MFSQRPIEPRGRWIALTAATVVYQFAYWPMVVSVVGGEEATSGGLWLGLAVTPLVFLVLAFTSRNPRPPRGGGGGDAAPPPGGRPRGPRGGGV